MAGAWYYHGIVSLFIEGEAYEQEKSSIESENNRPLLQDFPWWRQPEWEHEHLQPETYAQRLRWKERYNKLELTELKARDASCPKGKKMGGERTIKIRI